MTCCSNMGGNRGFESAKACFAETSMQTLTTQTLFANAFGSTTPMATSLLTMSCMFRPWVLYGEHLAMAKTSTQTLSIVQRRTRITNFRGKSCSLLTMSCMFLPWSLNGERWSLAAKVCSHLMYISVGLAHFYQSMPNWYWPALVGWYWLGVNYKEQHTRVAKTLSSVDRNVTCSCLAVFLWPTSSASAQNVQLTVPLRKKMCLRGK